MRYDWALMNLSAPNNLSASETVGDELERLEVYSGKIGMNTPEQALALLHGLDHAFERMQSLEAGAQSQRLAQTQMDVILAALRREAAGFIRDVGGVAALRQARAESNPPATHAWWYLDTWLMEKRRRALRRSLTLVGAVILVLVILGAVYQRFLAPDPLTLARYNSETEAGQSLVNGDLPQALAQVNEGLKAAPTDSRLLTLKGVILEMQGQAAQAQASYAAAQNTATSLEEFYTTRGQFYIMGNLASQALADAQQAVKIDPQSATGYLLMGQSHEMLLQYDAALTDYNHAFDAAGAANTPQLAAVARQRIAMLYQVMGQPSIPDITPTPTAK